MEGYLRGNGKKEIEYVYIQVKIVTRWKCWGATIISEIWILLFNLFCGEATNDTAFSSSVKSSENGKYVKSAMISTLEACIVRRLWTLEGFQQNVERKTILDQEMLKY